MVNKKNTLTKDDRKALVSVHRLQVVTEVLVAIALVALLTLNIAAAIPTYGIAVVIVLFITALLLLIIGIALSVQVSALKNSQVALASRTKTARRLIIAIWSMPVVIFVLAVAAFSQDPSTAMFLLGLAGILFAGWVGTLIALLANLQHVWRRFTKKQQPPTRLIVYGTVSLFLVLIGLFGSYTTTEELAYETTTTTDASLELGQQEKRQTGKPGSVVVRRNLLFAFETSSTRTEPVDEVIAKGSRRYQYMYCSNGSYRYYTAEQFKNPLVGFTHQSEDFCSKSGQGKQTALADTPPPEKVVQQVPTYYPSYRSPSSYTTTCNAYSFTNSITCHTY